MKRLVAKRKLNHGCIQCNNPILKGQVYYRKRTVFREDGRVYGYTTTYCPKCKYSNEQREKRFEKFKEKCHHPDEFVVLIWGYIHGEAVKEPLYERCMLCGEILF